MSKKRVAYFYDEDVGNFHYGEYLKGWKFKLNYVTVFVPTRTFLATYLSFYWRVFCSYTWIFSTIILSFNIIPDQNGSFEGKSDTKSICKHIITIKLKWTWIIFNLPLTLRFKHCKLIVF